MLCYHILGHTFAPILLSFSLCPPLPNYFHVSNGLPLAKKKKLSKKIYSLFDGRRQNDLIKAKEKPCKIAV